jgi:hypothetical protein
MVNFINKYFIKNTEKKVIYKTNYTFFNTFFFQKVTKKNKNLNNSNS